MSWITYHFHLQWRLHYLEGCEKLGSTWNLKEAIDNRGNDKIEKRFRKIIFENVFGSFHKLSLRAEISEMSEKCRKRDNLHKKILFPVVRFHSNSLNLFFPLWELCYTKQQLYFFFFKKKKFQSERRLNKQEQALSFNLPTIKRNSRLCFYSKKFWIQNYTFKFRLGNNSSEGLKFFYSLVYSLMATKGIEGVNCTC